MTAINGVNSVNFKGEQEQRSSGPGLGTIATTTVLGGVGGYLLKGKKVSLEGLDKDAFVKATKDLTGEDKANADAVKAYFDQKPEAKADEKAEGKSEKAEAKAEAKGTKAAKSSVAASGVTVENLFGNAEEIEPMKYLQEKYGYGSVQELMDGIKSDRIALGGPEGKALRSSIKSGTKGQTRSEKLFSKVEQSIKQEIAIYELQGRIDEEEFKVSGMSTGTKAEQAEKTIAQRRLDTMKKTLKSQEERLVSFEAELKDNKAYRELRKSVNDEMQNMLLEEVPEAPKGAVKDANTEFRRTTDNAAVNAGQHAKKEMTNRIKEDAKKKAEKDANKKGLKGAERQTFIKEAQDQAVSASKERIEKYVQLQQEKESLKRVTSEYTNRFKTLKHETAIEAKKGLIGSQRELSKQQATLLEKEQDLKLIQDAKKNKTKITKTQAQGVMDTAAAKAKDGIAKVANSVGEKAGKAGEEVKGSVAETAAKALEALKDKLPKELKKTSGKAIAVGAAIGLAAGIVIKWMFGGKSEE